MKKLEEPNIKKYKNSPEILKFFRAKEIFYQDGEKFQQKLFKYEEETGKSTKDLVSMITFAFYNFEKTLPKINHKALEKTLKESEVVLQCLGYGTRIKNHSVLEELKKRIENMKNAMGYDYTLKHPLGIPYENCESKEERQKQLAGLPGGYDPSYFDKITTVKERLRSKTSITLKLIGEYFEKESWKTKPLIAEYFLGPLTPEIEEITDEAINRIKKEYSGNMLN